MGANEICLSLLDFFFQLTDVLGVDQIVGRELGDVRIRSPKKVFDHANSLDRGRGNKSMKRVFSSFLRFHVSRESLNGAASSRTSLLVSSLRLTLALWELIVTHNPPCWEKCETMS